MLLTCSDFKFSVGDSLLVSCRESNAHRQSVRDTDKTVLSCLAWRCELALTVVLDWSWLEWYGVLDWYSNHIITRISIQTACLAFGGTGLCSYSVRGVDGSCAEHLTLESFTDIICQQSYLLLFGIPSPTHSYIPGLKLPFSANPSHRSPSFFFFKIHHMDSPDCLLLFLNISVFYF